MTTAGATALRFTVVSQPTLPVDVDEDDRIEVEDQRAAVVLDAGQSFRVIFRQGVTIPAREEIARALGALIEQRPAWRRRGWSGGIAASTTIQLPYPRVVSFLEAFHVQGRLRIHLFGQYAAHLTNLGSRDVLAVAYQQRLLHHHADTPPQSVRLATKKPTAGSLLWRWMGVGHDLALDDAPSIPRRRYLDLDALPTALRALSEPTTPCPLPSYSTLYVAGLWPLVKERMRRSNKTVASALDEDRNAPPTNGYDPDKGMDGLPDDPVVKAETMVHVAAHFVLALLGMYREEGASSARDALHPDRLVALTLADELEAYEQAAQLVDEWRPRDIPAI